VADSALSSILYVLHNGGGGTRLTTLDLLGHVAKVSDCYVLQTDVENWKFSRYVDGQLRETEDIRFSRTWRIDLPPDAERRAALEQVVERSRPDLVHVRHLIGNHPSIISRLKHEFDLPVVVSIHDHYLICPTIQLFDDQHQYCEGICTASMGECQVSRKWFRKMPPLKHAYVHDWRELIGLSMAEADALIVTSQTTGNMVRRHHPFLKLCS
jgi:hypothetical protein